MTSIWFYTTLGCIPLMIGCYGFGLQQGIQKTHNKCTGWLGHDWNPWEQHLTIGREESDGIVMKRHYHTRTCKKCNLKEVERLDLYEVER